MAPAGGGVKGFYRQAKKRGGVAKPSTSSKRSKNKPPQRCTAQGEGRGADQMEEEELRGFDMDMKYGPCIGVTRLRRWERAAAMGLSPPPHLQELLLRRGASAGLSSSRSPAPKTTTTDSWPRSGAPLTSVQLQCIWEGKI